MSDVYLIFSPYSPGLNLYVVWGYVVSCREGKGGEREREEEIIQKKKKKDMQDAAAHD